MATSGTYSFDPTADELLQEAWELIGKTGAEMTGDVARAARRSLTQLLLGWSNEALNLWQVDEQVLTLEAGVATYTLAAATIAPLDVSVRIGGQDRTLTAIGRSEYAAIPTKADRGTPTQYWNNRQARQPTITLYPTPDSAVTLRYWRMRMPQDVGALGNTLDIPVVWVPAITYGLAAALAMKFAPERYAMIAPIAKEHAAKAQMGDTQRGVPLSIMPNIRR